MIMIVLESSSNVCLLRWSKLLLSISLLKLILSKIMLEILVLILEILNLMIVSKIWKYWLLLLEMILLNKSLLSKSLLSKSLMTKSLLTKSLLTKSMMIKSMMIITTLSLPCSTITDHMTRIVIHFTITTTDWVKWCWTTTIMNRFMLGREEIRHHKFNTIWIVMMWMTMTKGLSVGIYSWIFTRNQLILT